MCSFYLSWGINEQRWDILILLVRLAQHLFDYQVLKVRVSCFSLNDGVNGVAISRFGFTLCMGRVNFYVASFKSIGVLYSLCSTQLSYSHCLSRSTWHALWRLCHTKFLLQRSTKKQIFNNAWLVTRKSSLEFGH